MKKVRTITFENLNDFKSRICALWQNQKADETYEFIFKDKETEDAYKDLIKCFSCEETIP